MKATNLLRQELALPWRMPPLTKNEVRRLHHHQYSKALAPVIETVRVLARTLAPVPAAWVILHWRVPDKRRRDGDGAAPTLSACLDGLVQAGVLPDDSWQYVGFSGIQIHKPVASRGGGLWLEVREVWR